MKRGKQILKRIEKEKRQERREIEHARKRTQELYELEKRIAKKISRMRDLVEIKKLRRDYEEYNKGLR